jgi:thioredoxin-dependent peroxiredoxin
MLRPTSPPRPPKGPIRFHEWLDRSWGMLFSHPADFTPVCTTGFPIIADPDRKVSELSDMIHPKASETATVRSVFLIAPDRTLRLILTYPMSSGRGFDEIRRVIDSIQLTDAQPVATSADWQPGQEVIVGLGISDEEAARRFPDYRAPKPYLRLTRNRRWRWTRESR